MLVGDSECPVVYAVVLYSLYVAAADRLVLLVAVDCHVGRSVVGTYATMLNK